MQVNFNSNCYSQKQNFGMAVTVTDRATRHLKSRYMSDKDLERFGKVIDRFKNKGDFIKGALDEVSGDLKASIFSPGRYFESVTEGFFSKIFRSPIHFIEAWADRADRVEAKLKNDVNLEKLVKRCD